MITLLAYAVLVILGAVAFGKFCEAGRGDDCDYCEGPCVLDDKTC